MYIYIIYIERWLWGINTWPPDVRLLVHNNIRTKRKSRTSAVFARVFLSLSLFRAKVRLESSGDVASPLGCVKFGYTYKLRRNDAAPCPSQLLLFFFQTASLHRWAFLSYIYVYNALLIFLLFLRSSLGSMLSPLIEIYHCVFLGEHVRVHVPM